MDKKSRILVTGASGMVGKNMLDLLEKRGYKNVLSPTFSRLDLRDQNKTEIYFKKQKPDYVFHFAARVGGIMANIKNPAVFLYDNVAISSNVINSAYKSGVKKLLNLGSSCIYPRASKQPMKEKYLLTGKLEPTNEGYALAKIFSLNLCEKYNEQHKTNFISLIPPNLYGPYERFDPLHSHVISALIIKFHKAKLHNNKKITLWGTGSAVREFLYAPDAVEAALYFISNYSVKDLNNEFINIGQGKGVSINKLARIIKKVVGYDGTISWDSSKPDGMPKKVMEVTKMKKYKFSPKVELEEGIIRLYHYYLKNGDKK